jgi:hypothetical protein
VSEYHMTSQTVTEVFDSLPAAIRTKLMTLQMAGMDSSVAFDSLSAEEQQTIEDALKGV